MSFYFTSITMNYFAKARVLCKSLKCNNPDAQFLLAVSEDVPQDICASDEPFDYIFSTRDLTNIGNVNSFYFKHTVTELCTAVKPFIASYIMEEYAAQKVFYLDPDIGVFHNLVEMESFLDDNSILLTPHQLKPEEKDIYIRENEILFLKRGSYNLGFFGVKNDAEGRAFLSWWKDRLIHYCFDDDYSLYPELLRDGLLGMFTDQKWMDLIPSFFQKYFIIRDPGYNVCTWNLSNRYIHKKDEEFFVNDSPLYFFHFSGYNSGAHRNELEKSLLYYPNNTDVKYLSNWYGTQLSANDDARYSDIPFQYNKYSNGDPIPIIDRKLYHIRKDVHHLFSNPFEVSDGYYHWVRDTYAKYYVELEPGSFFVNNNDEKEGVKDKTLFLFLFPYHSKRRLLLKKIVKKLLARKEKAPQ